MSHPASSDLGLSKTRRLRNQQWRTDAMSQIKWTNKFTAFAVGVGAGALLAMLFAPASGEDTREYLTGSLKPGLDGAASTGKRWTRRAQEMPESCVRRSVPEGRR